MLQMLQCSGQQCCTTRTWWHDSYDMLHESKNREIFAGFGIESHHYHDYELAGSTSTWKLVWSSTTSRWRTTDTTSTYAGSFDARRFYGYAL